MNNNIYKTLRISDQRPDEHHLAIDTTDGAATEIAKVVVRMAGQSEDNPVLVEFASELVRRYNDYIFPSPDEELVKSNLRTMVASLNKDLEDAENRSQEYFKFIFEINALLGDKTLTKSFRIKEAKRKLVAWLNGDES